MEIELVTALVGAGSALVGAGVGGFATFAVARLSANREDNRRRAEHEELLRRDSLDSAKKLLGIYRDMKREFMIVLGDPSARKISRKQHMTIWSEERSRIIAQESMLLTNERTRKHVYKIDIAFEDLYRAGIKLNRVSLQTCTFLAGDGYNTMAMYIRGEEGLPEGNPGFEEVAQASKLAGLKPTFQEIDSSF
ncbi:hypothetical protein HDC34_001924 [Pseudoclavibacter sp. JAI123]|uniref:hypothetical protein n=1 Tax=Pseudoclavibacter sp. JAI123 TaxID=2723065 RepID=UPI0015CA52ED|nr:hypothetical protein [Pseudoclavibacter sp. JAI123]NYF13630.1 hypothetical protein [Pseudoclavibacter sp. JAI123]